MKTNNKGFSLVELIVVIAIMAILAAVAIPTFSGFIKKANEASDNDFMANVEYAINLANAENHEFALTTITVNVDANGAFTTITYEATGVDGTVTVTADSTDDVEGTIASVLDWDYEFKAAKAPVTVTFAADSEIETE